jgi:hypothetical protein
MSQISKQLENRQLYVEAVVSSSEVNEAAIIERFLARYKDQTGAEEAAQALQTLLTFERGIATRRINEVNAAELTLSRELGEDLAAREQRDTPYADLIQYVNLIRDRVGTDGGAATARRLGLASALPNRLSAVESYIENAIKQCTHHDLTLSEPLTGTGYTTAQLADGLRARLRAHHDASADVTREERETQTARADRDEAIDDFQQDVFASAQILEGVYRQVGMAAHADRIRPSARRVLGRLEQDPISDLPDTDQATNTPEA